jgi:hypothetical protein
MGQFSSAVVEPFSSLIGSSNDGFQNLGLAFRAAIPPSEPAAPPGYIPKTRPPFEFDLM